MILNTSQCDNIAKFKARFYRASCARTHQPRLPLPTKKTVVSIARASSRALRSPTARAVISCLVVASAGDLAYGQQDPWGRAATVLGNSFSTTIARGLSLVAVVIGGLSLAFSEGGGKRAIAGVIFGCGAALGAAQFLGWLFS